MDCYSVESDVLVRKGHRNRDKEKNYISEYTRPDIHIVRKLCKAKHTKHHPNDVTDGAPSTSVVIKKAIAKISKRKFIPDTLYKDDTSSEIPLIKVTVIPKHVDTQTSRQFNKRRQTVKRAQSTVSNQESSLRSKNIYLVVTGRKADKIYEIKTTGSEKLSTNQSSSRIKYEDISLKKLHNYKHVIDSLNMDKKKKRDKKKKTVPQRKDSRTSLVNEIFGGAGITLQECICPNAKRKAPMNNVKHRRSRLRIIGELGLTNDDKYVINYAATVDGDTGIRNYSRTDERLKSNEASDLTSRQQEYTNCSSSYSTSNVIFNNKSYFRTHRDSNVQANLLEPTTFCAFSKNRGVRQESQGTQVDLDGPLDRNKKYTFRDQTIQCYCNCSNGTATEIVSSTTDAVNKSSTTKDTKSPLVIISVYSKQDSAENTTSSHTLIDQRPALPRRQSESPQHHRNKSKMNMYRSRSPSPEHRNYSRENPLNRTVDARFLNTKKKNYVRPASPVTQKKVPSPTDLSTTTTKSKTKNEFFKKLPVTFGSRDSRDTNIQSIKKKKMNDNNQKPVLFGKKEVGNYSYVSRIESNMKRTFDNQKQNYNGVKEQRNLNNISRNRREFNNEDSHRSSDDDYGSMENFLMLSEDNRDVNTRSLSQTLCYSPSTTAVYETSQHTNTAVGNTDSSEVEPQCCMKFTQTSRSYDELYESTSNTNFFAPIKHYHGDSCNIIDPLERDREIRKLLGLEYRQTLPRPITHEYYSGMFCRESRSKKKNDYCTKHVEARISRTFECKCCNQEKKSPAPKNRVCKLVKTKTTPTQYDLKPPVIPCIPLCSPLTHQEPRDNQLILNRNIQVYLQIEQFTKQKPIMLTRKQYDKLKKTIKSTVKLKTPKPPKCKKNVYKTYSVVSEGQIKKANKSKCCGIRDRGMQTKKGSRCQNKPKPPSKQSSKVSPNTSCVCVEVQTICSTLEKQTCNYLLLDRQVGQDTSNTSKDNVPRQTMSSLEIRYANVAFKRVTFSSTNVDQLPTESVYSNQLDTTSIHSLPKKNKKSATPNLGTSGYSLYSEPTGSGQSLKYLLSPRDSKQKRPFLRRLMSCLVMHSARPSNMKLPCGLTSKVSGVNSSIDSYYISTSLGAIELTSSMYDTSASFYSNHTIVPVNKIKRGFLSSVRGFLTSRRS
ncbi:PREDICTED: uncharacterized protein LOC106117956 isoform X2 [Papilio xuthus]|uniref:Uncharacterized protein LOC106117956 isoform X2 n=1 Tax=Papilio xuthus TaxID=66420 RepID=A0AAJ7E9B7_PAPXU|nr:PREDICTED: uncharacterized protein LOC106117956 isoform X2 [Papilio xuthus]